MEVTIRGVHWREGRGGDREGGSSHTCCRFSGSIWRQNRAQGKGVTEQDFGGVAIKKILVCSGARVWGRGGATKRGELGSDPAPAATRCNPGSPRPDPLSTCAPGPTPSDVTTLRQPGGSRGVWGAQGCRLALRGSPRAPRTAITGGCGAPTPGLGEVRGHRGCGRVGLKPQVC